MYKRTYGDPPPDPGAASSSSVLSRVRAASILITAAAVRWHVPPCSVPVDTTKHHQSTHSGMPVIGCVDDDQLATGAFLFRTIRFAMFQKAQVPALIPHCKQRSPPTDRYTRSARSHVRAVHVIWRTRPPSRCLPGFMVGTCVRVYGECQCVRVCAFVLVPFGKRE